MSKIVSAIVDKMNVKPVYAENSRGEITMSFTDAYEVQEFVYEIRKQGVIYGMELAKLTKEAPPMHEVPASIVRWTPRGEHYEWK